MDIVVELVSHFKQAHLHCSHRDTPLSAFILIVQALKNMVTQTLTRDDGMYDCIMGGGAAQEVVDCIHIRFNLDCQPISGRQVPLLDKHHAWTNMCDPFGFLWRSTFLFDGNVRTTAIDMITHYVPLWAPRCMSRRACLLEEFEVCLFVFRFLHLEPI